MGNIQELENSWLRQKLKRKRASNLEKTSSLNRESTGVSKEKQISVPSAVFYEKFWVTGNTITVLKWNISQSRKKLQILK
jgi:hypothetical protein